MKSRLSGVVMIGLMAALPVLLAGCSGSQIERCEEAQVAAILLGGIDPAAVTDAGDFGEPDLLGGSHAECAGSYSISTTGIDEDVLAEPRPEELLISVAIVADESGFERLDSNAVKAGFGSVEVSGDDYHSWARGDLRLNAYPLEGAAPPDVLDALFEDPSVLLVVGLTDDL